MRPQSLFPLFAPVSSLKGIGPRLAALVERVAGARVLDLLWHLPINLVDRRHAPTVADTAPGEIATLTVTVGPHHLPHNKRQPYKVVCSDDTGFVTLVFFHAKPDYLARVLPEGQTRIVSGKVDVYSGERQMTHPDHIVPAAERESVLRVEPVYPLTEGLSARVMARAVADAVEQAPDLPEWADPGLIDARGWISWQASLKRAHHPESRADLSAEAPARARLAYDELLAGQLAILLMRRQQRHLKGRELAGDGSLREKALAALPFELTHSQNEAMLEIVGDMAHPSRMLRLLQGDVGSGKTVVALLAMLIAVEAGTQAALMAPTEILARQHFATIEPLAKAAGVRVAILTGRDKGKAREQILTALKDGHIDIVVGTHALFSTDVEIKDLGLAVIDEQHRFGVHQRMALSAKGHQIDTLVMTATPIPRTLLLAAYGDMDTSRLTEKPAGRQPVDTRALPLDKVDEVIGGLKRAIAGGARAYWVCPLVEDSETSELAAATARHAHLERLFPGRVGLVHGRLSGAEKEKTMQAFAAGELDILVATTVIEVGVDVPEATVMVIEHAERFGLSQLHQLRGRVGRGTGKSSCLLLYQTPLGETAKARIDIMRQTEDGFRIAEEDLRLRGGGDPLGARQSGQPVFKLADLAFHGDLLEAARHDAQMVLEKDPNLESARGQALRTLLYLFERDQGVRLLRSG